MNTSKPASEILSMADRVDIQKKNEGFGILKSKFRMLLMGLVLSGCSSPAPVVSPSVSNSKPVVVIEKIEVITSPEIPKADETPVKEIQNPFSEPMDFSGFSLQSVGFHPTHQRDNTLAASVFREQGEALQKQSVASPLKVRTPDQHPSFSIAPTPRFTPSDTVRDRSIAPVVQRQNIPNEHPQELLYLYLLFTTLSLAAAGMVGHERIQARKIQKILADRHLQHGRL